MHMYYRAYVQSRRPLFELARGGGAVVFVESELWLGGVSEAYFLYVERGRHRQSDAIDEKRCASWRH